MTCRPGCDCASCLVPEHGAPKCTKHANCVGREGHGGDRVGLRRAIRVLAADVLSTIAKRVA